MEQKPYSFSSCTKPTPIRTPDSPYEQLVFEAKIGNGIGLDLRPPEVPKNKTSVGPLEVVDVLGQVVAEGEIGLMPQPQPEVAPSPQGPEPQSDL